MAVSLSWLVNYPEAAAARQSDFDKAMDRSINEDVTYVPYVDTDSDGESDGDPPNIEEALAMRAAAASSTSLNPQPPPAPEPARVSKISRKRLFEKLEQDAWDTPEAFYAEVTGIINQELPSGDMGLVISDGTHKAGNAYLHLTCVYRASGCPFLLKLLNRPREGGWVVRSQFVEGTTKPDPKHGSIYHCIHKSGAIPETPQITTFVSKKTKADAANDSRPPKRPRPSVPVTPALSAPAVNIPRSESAPAIAGQQASLYKMPYPNAAQSIVDGPLGQAQPVPGRPALNGALVADRVLAPPFARGQALQAHISPALSASPNLMGGMSIGTAYAGHSQSPAAERGPNHQPAPQPQAVGGPAQLQPQPQLASAAQAAGLSQAGYVPIFRPLPVVQAQYAAPSSNILPQWQYFFAKLNQTLLPLAPIVASAPVGLTLALFYNSRESFRTAAVDGLQLFGANFALRTLFADLMEKEGRRVWLEMKHAARKKIADSAKDNIESVSGNSSKRRQPEPDSFSPAPSEPDSASRVDGTGHASAPMELDSQRQPAPQPAPATRPSEPEPTPATPAPSTAQPADTPAPPAREHDGDVRMSYAPAQPRLQPQPELERQRQAQPPAASEAVVGDAAEKAPEPELATAVPEPVVEQVIEKERSPSPEFDYGEEPPINFVRWPAEMTQILTENGCDYLSIFRKRFAKGRVPGADLTGRMLQIFFWKFNPAGFYSDVAAWHIIFHSSAATEAAWRGCNKKQLAGAPVMIELCGQVGKLGSLQSPPQSAKKAAIAGGEPMLPRHSLSDSAESSATHLRERAPSAPKEIKKRGPRKSKIAAFEAMANGGQDQEDELDMLAGDSLSQELAATKAPKPAAVPRSVASSEAEAGRATSAVPSPAPSSPAPRPWSHSPARQAMNSPKPAPHPPSPRALGPFSLPTKEAQPVSRSASPDKLQTTGPVRKKAVNTPDIVISSDDEINAVQAKQQQAKAPALAAPSAPASVSPAVSGIPGLGSRAAQSPPPPTFNGNPKSSAQPPPGRPSLSATPSSSSQPGPSQAGSAADKQRMASVAASVYSNSIARSGPSGGPGTPSPAPLSGPSGSPSSQAGPAGFQGELSKKEALFAQKSGVSFPSRNQ